MRNFNLPAQRLADSLRAVGSQTNTNVLYNPLLVEKYTAPELNGTLSLDDALGKLLAGTGIVHRFVNEDTVVLERATPVPTNPGSRQTADPGVLRPVQGTSAASTPLRDPPDPVTSPQSAENSGAGGHLEEVVVTAQRKAERLQDVPISVNVIRGDSLAGKGIGDATALVAAVPGLEFSRVGINGTPYLRGVGSNAGNPNDEPSVALYVDGVYIPSATANFMGFNNVDRIEVLKGPQGTLFGRNATGGVIQVITRDPAHTPSVEAAVGYGNYQTMTGSAYATTGLSDNIAIDFASNITHMGEGYGRDVTLATETNKDSEYSFRSKLLINAGDRTEIRIAADYVYADGSISDWQLPQGVLDQFGNPEHPSRYDTVSNVANDVRRDAAGVSLNVSQEFDIARFVSISAYRKTSLYFLEDGDATPVHLLDPIALNGGQSSYSQEFQLMAPTRSAVDWLVGAYLFQNKPFYVNSTIAGSDIGGVLDITGRQRTRSASLFAQATAEVLPATKLTGGARYTIERLQYDANIDVGTGPIVFPTEKASYDKPTWRLALDHAFTSDVHTYVSYNRGVKSGGFDLLSPGEAAYKPESIDAYEVGLKSELIDQRVRFNAAAFWYNYKDIQVQGFRAAVVQTLNAAQARIKGLDFDVQAVPVENLTLSAGLEYLHGRYLSFPNSVSYAPSPFYGAPQTLNVSGNVTIRSPEFSGNLGGEYKIATGVGNFLLSANLSYMGGYFFTADDRFKQRSYDLLAASVRWVSLGERYNLSLWSRNLSDDEYLMAGVSSSSGYLSVQAPPRTYGVTAGIKF